MTPTVLNNSAHAAWLINADFFMVVSLYKIYAKNKFNESIFPEYCQAFFLQSRASDYPRMTA